MKGILATILPRPARRPRRLPPQPATFVRYPAKYWAVLCDVDYFKEYADIYGHRMAEEVLGMVGAILARTLGDHGPAFNRKDEGFVMVLPGGSLDQARSWAEDHRLAIEQLLIPHQGSPLGGVTVSMGIAAMESLLESGPDEAFDQADTALARAKRLGSNQVATAPRMILV